jgi:peptidyl-prolyl cis-trans isomerase D
MITWIQTYFQKHFRSIFAVLLGITILSFVFGINASGGFGRADRQSADRPFFGHNLTSEQDGGRLMRDGANSARLKGASQQMEDSMIQQYTLTRVAALALADELHLPAPAEKEVAAYISTLRIFQDPQGRFDPKRYAEFGDGLKGNAQLTTADVSRIFRDDARIESVNKLIGGPGYALTADVRDLLSRTDAKWSIAVATLDYAAYDAGITATDEALKKFFEEKAGNYEVPPRAKLSAVQFNGEEFLPAGAPLPEEQLRAFYNANLARFPAPADAVAKDAAAPATGTDNFTKVRLQVEIAFRAEMGSRAAVKVANDFAVSLYERKTKANSAELAAFIASQNRTAAAIEPFAPDSPPASMPWLAYYGEQISRLSQERFFSDPLPTPNGAIILLWNDALAAYQPAFAEVREKVTADYKENEKRKRFVAQGQMLNAKLNAAVKSGTAFEKAAADAKLEVKSFANFTLQDTPKDLPAEVRGTLQTIKTGEVAPMIFAGEKGLLVYAAQKQLPDLTPGNPRFTEVRGRLMAYLSSATGNATLGGLVKAELDKTAPDKKLATK